MALLPSLVLGLMLVGCGGRHAPWTSRAAFTVRSKPVGADPNLAGTYTAANSTVPPGDSGSAGLDPGIGASPGTPALVVSVGADPVDGPNVSQFRLFLTAYHGVDSYVIASKESNGAVDVSVRSGNDDITNAWSVDSSNVATCAIKITADAAMKDPSIREIRGRVTCHGLYDATQHTSAAELSAQFDVFAEVWCGDRPVRPCRAKPPP